MPTDGDFLNNHRYEILRVLSDQGGMGVVYLATDLSLGDTVVIKHSRYTDEHLRRMYPNLTAAQLRHQADTLRQAFEREAKLLSRLHHSALPPVRDYFRVGDDQQFFVMKFIPGQDLRELLVERQEKNLEPYSLGDVLDWADQLLDALAYLHTQFDPPIIHRDIKPANLKLKPDGQIVLLDFGLAKGAAGEMSIVNRSIPGYTLQYAPPEQLRHEGTDARSDLYSLAVTLHHLLTGIEPPSAIVRASAVLTRPDPLFPAHEINPQIPFEVSAILQRAASLYPDVRPATAAEMREALRRARQPEPVPNPAQPSGKPSEPTTMDPAPSPSTPSDSAPGSQSGEPSTIERPRPQPAAPAAEPIKVDLPDQPSDIAPPRSNRWKYAAAGVVLALMIGLVMFLNRNSSAPANASSEAKPLSLAPTPASTVADSPTPPASQTAALQSFTEDLGNGGKLEMLAIQGGSFTMGSEAHAHIEQPHRVTVPSFCLGKYEVTQAQWRAVMGNNPSNFTDSDNLPVDSVSWNMAKEFCRKLSQMTGKNYRLPTEAEWEYACRAGTIGDYAGDPNLMAWSLDNSGQSTVDAEKFSRIIGFDYRNFRESNKNRTHPVGQKRPNAFGLYDMHGNVWEWCEDIWHFGYDGAPTDGSAWLSGGEPPFRVQRGGGWADSAGYNRSAQRGSKILNNDGNTWQGLRVALSVKTR